MSTEATVTLRCDGEGENGIRCTNLVTVTHERPAQAVMLARGLAHSAGWLLNRGRETCPDCARAKHRRSA